MSTEIENCYSIIVHKDDIKKYSKIYDQIYSFCVKHDKSDADALINLSKYFSECSNLRRITLRSPGSFGDGINIITLDDQDECFEEKLLKILAAENLRLFLLCRYKSEGNEFAGVRISYMDVGKYRSIDDAKEIVVEEDIDDEEFELEKLINAIEDCQYDVKVELLEKLSKQVADIEDDSVWIEYSGD